MVDMPGNGLREQMFGLTRYPAERDSRQGRAKRRFGRFKPAIEADIIPSLLVHLGIWTAVGAALGVAFGIGSGNRNVLVRSLFEGRFPRGCLWRPILVGSECKRRSSSPEESALTQAEPRPTGSSSSARELAEPFATSQSSTETSTSGDRDTSKSAGTHDVRDRFRIWIWRSFLCMIVLVAGYSGLRAVRLGATNPDEIWKQAEADLENGNLGSVDKALAQLGRLRKPGPLDWFLRGQLAVARHHADEAIDFLSHVPDGDQAAPRARLLAGQTELRRSRARHAEKWLVAATRLDPRAVQAHRELIYIYSAQLRRTELNAEFLALSQLSNLTFENAYHWCLLRSYSWEPAKMLGGLQRYIEADPDDRWSRLALAENYRRMGRSEDALAALAGLPRSQPEVIDVLARIELDRQGVSKAERLVATGPVDNPLLARLRGQLALARGDANSAQDHFRIALAAEPLSREALFGLTAALQRSGDSKTAEPYRRAAANLDRLNSLVQRAAAPGARNDSSLMRQFGAACAALELNELSRAWYKLAISADPLDSESQQALYRLSDPKVSRP
jgi:predicted Zn-dependent protease